MSIYDEFFNLNEPCPDSIENCQQLRNDYIKALADISHDNNCQGCQLVNLKAEFQTKVWKGYYTKLGISV
jgi:hypothetical protein